MKAGIAIDKWKLPVFKRLLLFNGYTFEKKPGLTDDSWMLLVETNDLPALEKVIKQCQKEAARSQQ